MTRIRIHTLSEVVEPPPVALTEAKATAGEILKLGFTTNEISVLNKSLKTTYYPASSIKKIELITKNKELKVQ